MHIQFNILARIRCTFCSLAVLAGCFVRQSLSCWVKPAAACVHCSFASLLKRAAVRFGVDPTWTIRQHGLVESYAGQQLDGAVLGGTSM